MRCAIRDTPNAAERKQLASYFWRHLHLPCQQLSIPVELAVQMVLQFTKFMGIWSRYKGCAHGILSIIGVKGLTHKLWRDSNVLIPRLARSTDMKMLMTGRLEKFARLYFASTAGHNSVITPSEATSPAWGEQYHISYTLTERGKCYETNWGGNVHAHLPDDLAHLFARESSVILSRHNRPSRGIPRRQSG